MRIRRTGKRKKGPLLAVISAVLLVCLLEAFLGGCSVVRDTRYSAISPLAAEVPTRHIGESNTFSRPGGETNPLGN